jgi:hypothetical protein
MRTSRGSACWLGDGPRVLVLVFLGMGVLARVSLSGFTTSDAAREHELHQRWNDIQQNQGASSGGLRGTPK